MKKSRILMFIASISLVALFIYPLWTITLVAPQYPEPLGLNIHINKLTDGIEFNDVNNIDLLNHYIGMHHLPSKVNIDNGVIEPFKEFTFMPIIVGFMVALGLVLVFVGKQKLYGYWFALLSIFGLLGVYDFYSWLQKYGSDLDPNAILKMIDPLTGEVMAYNPPIFGFKQMLNFEVYSYPGIGAYFIMSALGFAVLAFFLGKKENKKG